MNTLLVSAWLSSLCLALMVIFDRLMVGDCYRNKPKQAWFVASFSGVTLGLLATMIAWLYFTTTSETSIGDLQNIMANLAFPYGLIMVAAGIMTMQVLYHYFQAFIPEDGHEVNETSIAMWLASSPLWIFLALAMIQATGIQLPLLSGLGEAVISLEYGGLMLVSVLALMQFERVGQGDVGTWRQLLNSRYLRAVILIQVFTVGYTLLLSGVLRTFDDSLDVTLALLPFYILGFSSGMIWVMFSRTDRTELRSNMRRIKHFVRPILLAEVVGILVFFLEFFALSELDPTLVNLIIGAHVVLVFILMWGLRYLRLRMDEKGIRRYRFCGLRIKANKISFVPLDKSRVTKEFSWLAISLIAIGSCIIYAS